MVLFERVTKYPKVAQRLLSSDPVVGDAAQEDNDVANFVSSLNWILPWSICRELF